MQGIDVAMGYVRWHQLTTWHVHLDSTRKRTAYLIQYMTANAMLYVEFSRLHFQPTSSGCALRRKCIDSADMFCDTTAVSYVTLSFGNNLVLSTGISQESLKDAVSTEGEQQK
eukprot:IDg4656t1